MDKIEELLKNVRRASIEFNNTVGEFQRYLNNSTIDTVSVLKKAHNQQAVRVRTFDEDFCIISLRDCWGGQVLTFEQAMAELKSNNCGNADFFTRKQAAIVLAYKGAINGALRYINADPMDGWYWTNERYSEDKAWAFSTVGVLGYAPLRDMMGVRLVLPTEKFLEK